MIREIELDGIKYKVFYVPKKKRNGKDILMWNKLVINLWSVLTNSQKQKIIIHHPFNNDIKIINFHSITDYFKYNFKESITLQIALCNRIKEPDFYEKLRSKYNCVDPKKPLACTCGVTIEIPYVIINEETEKKYIIGIECINWWRRKKVKWQHVNLLREIKKCLTSEDESKRIVPNYCQFCYKPTTNCEKCKTKTIIRQIVEKWRTKTRKSFYNKYLLNQTDNEALLEFYISNYKHDLLDTIYIKNVPRIMNDLIKRYLIYNPFKKCHYLSKTKYIRKFKRVDLVVKYKDKEDAKKLGAMFDWDKKVWYCFGYNTELISKYK